ncbi:hypothetical protein KIL84_022071, partial [Mauremys mutica]
MTMYLIPLLVIDLSGECISEESRIGALGESCWQILAYNSNMFADIQDPEVRRKFPEDYSDQ